MKRFKIVYFLVLLVLVNGQLWGQKSNVGLSISSRAGFLLVHHKGSMAHLSGENSYGGNLGVNILTTGEKYWQQVYKLPELNFEFSYLNIGNPEILGKSFAVQGGAFLPFVRANKWAFGMKLNAGLAYLTRPYHEVDNPKNNAIGSNINWLVDIGVKVDKQFQRHNIALEAGITHISNGAYKMPNLGLNMPFVGLRYTYYFDPIVELAVASDSSTFQNVKSWSFFTQVIASTKQVQMVYGSNYGIIGLTNFTQYKFNNKVMVEGGLDLSYNQSIVKQTAGEWDRGKNLQVGSYAAFALSVHRFHLYAGMGVYFYNPLLPYGVFYHKLGGRFQIAGPIWGSIGIKSHWAKADYFEYGIAYRWK